MKPFKMHKTLRAYSYRNDEISPLPTDLLVETPLQIIINDERRILIMVTPGMIEELLYGFLFTEGLIREIPDVTSCRISTVGGEDGEQLIKAAVTVPVVNLSTIVNTKRVSYSSCGICGKENYYDLKRGLGRVKSRHRFSMKVVMTFLKQLEDLQPLYKKTGGAHAAVLFERSGKPIIYCEDMGRHNALDKLIGTMLIKGTAAEDKAVLSSGRASLEMILKCARAGIPVFVAKSRPTSRAVEAAKFYNITLVDMAKDSNRLYTHVRRIEGFG